MNEEGYDSCLHEDVALTLVLEERNQLSIEHIVVPSHHEVDAFPCTHKKYQLFFGVTRSSFENITAQEERRIFDTL